MTTKLKLLNHTIYLALLLQIGFVKVENCSAEKIFCADNDDRGGQVSAFEFPHTCNVLQSTLTIPGSAYPVLIRDDLIVPANAERNLSAYPNETVYRNVLIGIGASLYVPSGSVIRASGYFLNAGTIEVTNAANGGIRMFNLDRSGLAASSPAHPGRSTGIAGDGGISNSTQGAPGGYGSRSLGGNVGSLLSLRPGLFAGGGGGAATSRRGWGGGTFVVIARGRLVNGGNINAAGSAGVIKLGHPLYKIIINNFNRLFL
jgi:hypothetical protein